jgi:hypothetical protein
MRNILSFLILVTAFLMISSCKKNGTQLSPASSQFWLKVDNNVPDFTIEFNAQDTKNNFKGYTIDYANKEFDPNIKTVTDNTTNETWVLVYKDFDKTDEITLQLSGDSNIYKAKGFGHGEKRFIEISCKSGGDINVIDRDITTITKIINVE